MGNDENEDGSLMASIIFCAILILAYLLVYFIGGPEAAHKFGEAVAEGLQDD